MRIISQDKTEDIPYELSRLYTTMLGDYYTDGDAKTVLAEVRAAYRNEENVFIMPTADGIARKRLGHE